MTRSFPNSARRKSAEMVGSGKGMQAFRAFWFVLPTVEVCPKLRQRTQARLCAVKSIVQRDSQGHYLNRSLWRVRVSPRKMIDFKLCLLPIQCHLPPVCRISFGRWIVWRNRSSNQKAHLLSLVEPRFLFETKRSLDCFFKFVVRTAIWSECPFDHNKCHIDCCFGS